MPCPGHGVKEAADLPGGVLISHLKQEDNMKLRIASFVAAIALGANIASAQSIGIYGDPAGANCNLTAGVFQAFNWYILATLGGAAAAGTTGGEFRVDNWPASWSFNTITPNAGANLTLGGPLSGGCNIAFPACQPGSGGVVLLYAVNTLPLDAQSNRTVAVLKHTSPSNINFQCPLMRLCDIPVFTKICVSGGQAKINGPGNCTVAVERKTWSNVKALYNN